ncbi:hypothetical protein [Leptolyngbya sp. 7M]|uniref:hypothetical protein n=1 Tax=Leptolyngbya sp. 7M TaxID=2812896 RepID=UPI001B8C0FCE|nr:hypothetical protein [Leptolyngbya sp. 7M]QYO68901.1 hypothetical protein JVX88_25530 [Leptolyngbya sp. 7M]
MAEIKETSTVRPKRPRRKTSQPREVVWEQPAGLGFGFMITAIILILLTVGVLALGLYLR